MSLLCFISPLHAQDEGPLHLVVSKVGNRMVFYETDDETTFTLMAEITGKLNFGVRGDFDKAEIVNASTVASDGKTYTLEAIGEQPRPFRGGLMRFLSVTHGDAHSEFSIGKWSVIIRFKVDGVEYTHAADYLITWRKADEGIWQNQQWANEAEPQR